MKNTLVRVGLGVLVVCVVAAFYFAAVMVTTTVLRQLGFTSDTNVMLVNAGISTLLILTALSSAFLVRKFIFKSALPCLFCTQMAISRRSILSWIAFSFALTIGSWVLLLIVGQGVLSFGSASLGMALLAAIVLSLAPGVSEEIFFRYLLFGGLKHYWGKWPAALICGVLFGVAHLDQVDTVLDGGTLIIAATSVTLMFISIYEYSGTIWAPAIVHTIWDVFFLNTGFVVNSIYHTKEAPQSVFLQLDLATTNKWITGGGFGVEQGGITIAVYLIVAAVFFRLSASKV